MTCLLSQKGHGAQRESGCESHGCSLVGQSLPGTPVTSLGLWDPQLQVWGHWAAHVEHPTSQLTGPIMLTCRLGAPGGSTKSGGHEAIDSVGPQHGARDDLCSGGKQEQRGQLLVVGTGESWLSSFSEICSSGLG